MVWRHRFKTEVYQMLNCCFETNVSKSSPKMKTICSSQGKIPCKQQWLPPQTSLANHSLELNRVKQYLQILQVKIANSASH